MAAVVVTVVCWMILCVPVSEATTSGICQNFKSLNLSPGASVTHSCPAKECSNGSVVGTDLYFEYSDICLAALHSGVLTSLGAEVTVTRDQHEVNHVVGTAKNRIVSDTKARNRKVPLYSVESAVQGEGEVGEVLMVHNGASDDALRFTCLSQDNKSPISPSSLKRWNYKPLPYFSVESGEDSPRMVCKIYRSHNPHAVRLLGSHRGEDVLAVVQYSDDRDDQPPFPVRRKGT